MYQNVDNSVPDSEHVKLRVGHENPLFTKVEAAGAREVYWRAPPEQHMPAEAQTTVYQSKTCYDEALSQAKLKNEKILVTISILMVFF